VAGFLFSYAALITHESDFYIAMEKRLLSEEVIWPAWTTFVRELDREYIYPHFVLQRAASQPPQ